MSETVFMLESGAIVIGWHVPGDRQKITKSVGTANAWEEAGYDVQPLVQQPIVVRSSEKPQSYCSTCGHVAPLHWDLCAEADDAAPSSAVCPGRVGGAAP